MGISGVGKGLLQDAHLLECWVEGVAGRVHCDRMTLHCPAQVPTSATESEMVKTITGTDNVYTGPAHVHRVMLIEVDPYMWFTKMAI